MNEVFVPPNIGNSADANGQGTPNVANIAPGQERNNQILRTVAKSQKIRKATSTIIKSRAQFKAYLQQNGLDLFTSAIEFQTTGDFILSSYVRYPNYNNYLEPLTSFLPRYPNLIAPVTAIRDQLRGAKGDMDVISGNQNH
jgi:hypothetical protein